MATQEITRQAAKERTDTVNASRTHSSAAVALSGELMKAGHTPAVASGLAVKSKDGCL